MTNPYWKCNIHQVAKFVKFRPNTKAAFSFLLPFSVDISTEQFKEYNVVGTSR
jgi:hypothetical protein